MTDDKIMERVRKLLAKAERAGTEHEAEAFTAKATELMLKYSIDEALLQQSGEKPGEVIVARRVTVEGYAKAKLSLMHKVARGLGLQSVEYAATRHGWSTGAGQVIGWESDVAAFEVLFASLQMQAASEAKRELKRVRDNWPALRRARNEWLERNHMASQDRVDGWNYPCTLSHSERRDNRKRWYAENPEPEDPGREMPHGRSFMQSFLIGYANVVGDRLYKQRKSTVADAEAERPGTALAVVDRDKAVKAEYDRLHPPSSFGRGTAASTSSNAGYYSGRAAGARANLGGTSVAGGRKAIGR